MTDTCPYCKSKHIATFNYARKAGSTIGSVAGASMAIHSIRIGTTVGAFMGPPGVVIGGIGGLIVAGLTGAIIGGTTGTRLGAFVDDNMLNNFQCQVCGRVFNQPGTEIEGSYIRHLDHEEDDESFR